MYTGAGSMSKMRVASKKFPRAARPWLDASDRRTGDPCSTPDLYADTGLVATADSSALKERMVWWYWFGCRTCTYGMSFAASIAFMRSEACAQLRAISWKSAGPPRCAVGGIAPISELPGVEGRASNVRTSRSYRLTSQAR